MKVLVVYKSRHLLHRRHYCKQKVQRTVKSHQKYFGYIVGHLVDAGILCDLGIVIPAGQRQIYRYNIQCNQIVVYLQGQGQIHLTMLVTVLLPQEMRNMYRNHHVISHYHPLSETVRIHLVMVVNGQQENNIHQCLLIAGLYLPMTPWLFT